MSIVARTNWSWLARALVVGAFLGVPALAARGARADDVDDVVDNGLSKIKDQAECRSRCNSDSLSCMAGCPNGQQGASCRANCVLASSNCSQRCN